MKQDKKKVIIYLIWAFVVAWALQVIAGVVVNVTANSTGLTSTL